MFGHFVVLLCPPPPQKTDLVLGGGVCKHAFQLVVFSVSLPSSQVSLTNAADDSVASHLPPHQSFQQIHLSHFGDTFHPPLPSTSPLAWSLFTVRPLDWEGGLLASSLSEPCQRQAIQLTHKQRGLPTTTPLTPAHQLWNRSGNKAEKKKRGGKQCCYD